MRYELRVNYTDGSHNETLVYTVDVRTLDELKTAFLKRFGNIRDVPNRLLNEKPLVKQLTYAAEDLSEWQDTINEQTRWELRIRLV